MKARYVGDDKERDLALPGGFVHFERMKWVDLDKAAEAAGIGAHHLEVVLAGLGDDWETESSRKQQATARKETER